MGSGEEEERFDRSGEANNGNPVRMGVRGDARRERRGGESVLIGALIRRANVLLL